MDIYAMNFKVAKMILDHSKQSSLKVPLILIDITFGILLDLVDKAKIR